MNTLALNPESYEGTYKLIGGELSLDFINTVSWPDTPKAHDWFDVIDNVFVWASEVGLQVSSELRSRSQEVLQNDLKALKQVRSDLKSVLKPLAFNVKPPVSSINTLDSLIHESFSLRYLDANENKWKWRAAGTPKGLIAPVIWNAAFVLTTLDHKRLKYCGRCEWLFYDKTRSGTRRWCDMADCGGRDKALRYYHRKKDK
ncbi:MAG: CGNR zinc finger domain-containing protein [Bacteroidota bacterium]